MSSGVRPIAPNEPSKSPPSKEDEKPVKGDRQSSSKESEFLPATEKLPNPTPKNVTEVSKGEQKPHEKTKESPLSPSGGSKASSPVGLSTAHTTHMSSSLQPEASPPPITPINPGDPMPEATALNALSGISSPRPYQTSPERPLSPCRRFSLTPLELRVSPKAAQLENMVSPDQPLKSGRAGEDAARANQEHLPTAISSVSFPCPHVRSKSLPHNLNLPLSGIEDSFTPKGTEMPRPLPQSSVAVAANQGSMPLETLRPIFPNPIFPGSFQGTPLLGDDEVMKDAPHSHIVKECSGRAQQRREGGEGEVAPSRVLDMPEMEPLALPDQDQENSLGIDSSLFDGEISKTTNIESRGSLFPKVERKEQEEAPGAPGEVARDIPKSAIISSSTDPTKQHPEALTALRDRIPYHSFDHLSGHTQTAKEVKKDTSASAVRKGSTSYREANASSRVETADKGKRSSITGNSSMDSISRNQGHFARKTSQQTAGSAVGGVPSSVVLDVKEIKAQARNVVDTEAGSPGKSGSHSPTGKSVDLIQELKDLVSQELKRLNTKSTPPALSYRKEENV